MKIDRQLDFKIDCEGFEPYQIDCSQCCGLCCVALYFSKSDGFPCHKNAGTPCRNLQHDYTCSIHSALLHQGLKGCMAYDCFGAGQRITSLLPEPPDWNAIAEKEAKTIFDSFQTVMQVHQILWYLTMATTWELEKWEKDQCYELLSQGKAMVAQPLEKLQNLNLTSFHATSTTVLKRVSFQLAAKFHHAKVDGPKNHMGKSFQKKNLSGKDFSMSLLIASNLEGANLTGTNFLGADLRDANIKDTDLSQSLFLTQMQINTTKGNVNTILPPYLTAPISWQGV